MNAIVATTDSPAATQALAAAIAGLVREGDLIVLAGDLGTGKTTFTQGFGRRLGVDAPITSPTFTLMNHYPAAAGLTVLHADVYRLDKLQEIVDLGLSELLDEGAVALVEWGDVAEPVLPADYLEVRIAHLASDEGADDQRHFTFRTVGASWAARASAVADAVKEWLA